MSTLEVDKIIPQSGTATQLGESGDTITIPAGATITNNGTATGFGSADTEKVKVSANDTTAGFLNGKLVAGTNISLTEGTDGGNETLTAALSTTVTNFTSTGIDDNADATAMTINSSEQVGIGTTSPSCALDINGGSVNGNVFKTTTSGDNNYLAIDNTSTGGVEWVLNSSGNGSGNGGGNFAIQGPDSNTVRVMVHSNGVTSFNNGIALGVGTANTASNVLDDYEEGTWTPLVDGASLGAVGYYKKIGKICLVHFGNQTGAALALNNGDDYDISGLPFSMMNDGGDAWKYGSVPSASFADATASYYSQPLTGRQNNSGAIHIMNRSGVNVSSSDPVNVSMIYSTT